MRIILVLVIVLLTTLGLVSQTPSQPKQPGIASASTSNLMTPMQFHAFPAKPADDRFSYGTDANQVAELRVPFGVGPHPVVILIHGGCFRADFAKFGELGPIGDALKAKGVATWNIEYRRLGQAGSGWPGTYQDIGRGVDYLRSVAVQNHLDLTRVIVLGHSDGGHFALWVAARFRLPKSSSIYVSDPLPVRGVIDLAGPPNIEDFIPYEQMCGGPVVEQIHGGKPADVRDHYAQASAIGMLPLGVPQTLIWGQQDRMSPVASGETYIQTAKRAGDLAQLLILPAAGHFEIATPFSPAWPAVESEILSLLEK